MTPDWTSRAVFALGLLGACLSSAMLATPPAVAQGSGGSGAAGGIDPPASSAATSLGSGGRPGQAQPGLPGTGPRPGLAADAPSGADLVEQQRAAGVAPSTERLRDQLEDLNQIARELAPSVPVPAPGVEGADTNR